VIKDSAPVPHRRRSLAWPLPRRGFSDDEIRTALASVPWLIDV
jgi:hypothetical protein